MPKAVEVRISRFHHHPVDECDEPGTRRCLSGKPFLPKEKTLVRGMAGEERENRPNSAAEFVCIGDVVEKVLSLNLRIKIKEE